MKKEVIGSVDDVKKILERSNYKIFGLGGFPSTRSEVAGFIRDYEIIFINKTGEFESVKRNIRVRQFKKKYPDKPYFLKKPESLLLDKRVVDLINQDARKKKIGVYVYLTTDKSLEICRKNHWRLIGNPMKVYKRIDDRYEFLKILENIGYKRPGYVTLNLKNLASCLDRVYDTLGEKFVIQLLDEGGGRGTFFIDGRKEGESIMRMINSRLETINKLDSCDKLIASRFIDGPVMSIMSCITRENGILSSYVQYQLIDIRESVIKKDNAKGVFCGHDWSLSNEIPEEVHKKAEELAEKIGKELKKKGALGIFGLDFIWDEEKKEVCPLEVNPRLLGSFPTIVHVQLGKGEIPLVAFHILDFLDIPYRIKDRSVYKKSLKREGSQLLLFNPKGYDITCTRGLRGGVYSMEKGKIKFLRLGVSLSDIRNSNEFILTDGVPVRGNVFKKNGKIMRIMAKRGISKNQGRSLNQWARLMVRGIYKEIRFKKYES